MRFAKRIVLFLTVNILVVISVSFLLNLLNVQPFLSQYGLNLKSLALFCLIWGMVGSGISLALSRVMAKWMMGVKIVDTETQDPQLKKLVTMVHALALQAQLPIPEVGTYTSPEVNAFATGPTKKRALIAVSTGLLQKMSDRELEGVLAHEMAHISNGDMVTMALIQGVINAFVMFLARVLAFALSGLGRNRDEQSHSTSSMGSYMMFVFIFEIVFMLLGSIIVAWFSRKREFRADRGGAYLAGKGQMVAALESLLRLQRIQDPATHKASLDTLKISSRRKSGLISLFASHPPLEERIARLNDDRSTL